MRTVYWVWSMVVLVMVVMQIGLAGYGAFFAANKLEDEGSTIDDKVFEDGFGFHVGLGYLVIARRTGPVVIGLIAGIGKWRLGKHGLLFGLLLLQLWLAWIGLRQPFPVGFLHPINAFVILGLTLVDRAQTSGMRVRRARQAATPAPAPRRRDDAPTRARLPVLVADEERRADACVGDVHRQPCGGVAEVVAVVHPDPGLSARKATT